MDRLSALGTDALPHHGGPDVSCSDCAYYKDVLVRQVSDGAAHLVGTCAYEAYQAKTLDELRRAEVLAMDCDAPACEDFRRD